MRQREDVADGGPAQLRLNIGVTAHRDLVDREVPRMRAEVRGFLQHLRAGFPDLPLQLICALASGGDQLVAEEALALGIELIVPLPMAQADYEDDFEDAAALAQFRALLARAHVRTLPMAPGNTLESVRVRGPARNRQYAQLGMFISSHCQVLLALWDGNSSLATGGTAQVVEFHLHNTMPGFRIDEAAPNLLADDESDLIYHIDCPRRLPHAEEGPELAPGVAAPRWLTLNRMTPGDTPVPLHYRHVFDQMEAFNRDVARHAEAIAREAPSLLDAGMPCAPPPRVRDMDALYAAADWLAVHYRHQVRTSMLLTHALAAGMGLAFILYSDVASERLYVALFLLLFALAAVARWIGLRREWHRKYLDYRGLAEGLRVQLYWRLADVEIAPDSSLGYDSFLQKQDVDLSWIRHAMRGTGLLRDGDSDADDARLRWVIARWVGTGGHGAGGGQTAYFRDGGQRRERAYRVTTLLGEIALAGGLAGALALLVGGDQLAASVRTQLLLAMGLLPLLAGIRESLSYRNADKELIKQFRFMHRLFESCRWRLDRATTDTERRHLLRALGCACLEEHAEWILLHRERPLDAGGMSG